MMKRNVLFSILLVVSLGSLVFADDFNPPSFRGGPLSVEAEWDFDVAPTNWFFIPPDTFNTVSGTGDETLYNVFQTHAEVDSMTNWTWFNGPFGMGLQTVNPNSGIGFSVQNWVDEMPWKDIRIQITAYGTPGIIQGYFDNFQNLLTVEGQKELDLGTDEDDIDITWNLLDFGYTSYVGNENYDEIEAWADLRLWPNPDWEKIGINAMPAGIVLNQVYIDTISTPEPLTLTMLALGGLAVFRKKH